jgi:antitoxin component YwqK of YwqJK toxin-antitoxin module
MTKYLLLFIIIISKASFAQSFELLGGDTINYIDQNNKKQGHWIFWGRMKKLPNYKDDQKVEEGGFVDNLKEGVWKKYFPNGTLENEISFKNGIAKGKYINYFDNGKMQEEGLWTGGKQVGKFVRYHPNGKIAQEFNFNTQGKREGSQKYYYDNGNLMIEGVWAAGNKDGVVREYYNNGDLKSEKTYSDGKVDETSVKTFEPKRPEIKTKPEKAPEKTIVKVQEDEKLLELSGGNFTGNGQAKLYNKNRQISKEGLFEQFKLISGKEYIYNENGILIRIAIYKNGVYMGDGIIEE